MMRRAVVLAGWAAAATTALAQNPSAYTNPAMLGPARFQSVGIQWAGHFLNPSNDPVSAENVAEVRGHTNIIGMVHSPAQRRQNDGALAALGPDMAGLLFVDSVFQARDGTPLDALTVVANLLTLHQAMQTGRSAVKYLAFDETLWRRQVGHCGPDPVCAGNGPLDAVTQDMVPRIEAWTQQLRLAFPGIGVAYILAHAMARPGNVQVPVNADLYGFNCYNAAEACSTDHSSGATYSIQTLFDSVKAKVNALNNAYGGFRRMVLVPPAMMSFDRSKPRPTQGWTGNGHLMVDLQLADPARYPDSAALHLLQQNLALASDPMVAMVGTFIWNSLQEGDITYYGARGLPQVRAFLELEGRLLLNKAAVPNTSPPVVEFVASRAKPGSGIGSIWAWASSNATSCRSVTEASNADLQNLPPNGVLYQPPTTAPPSAYTIECTGPYGSRRKSLTAATH